MGAEEAASASLPLTWGESALSCRCSGPGGVSTISWRSGKASWGSTYSGSSAARQGQGRRGLSLWPRLAAPPSRPRLTVCVLGIQQVQLVLLALHVAQQVVCRHIAALGLFVICPQGRGAFQRQLVRGCPGPTPTTALPAPQPTLIGDERGRGVKQHRVTPCVTLATVQPGLTAQPWGHVLQVEAGGREDRWVMASSSPTPEESHPRRLPVHERQAAGAALAHAVVEAGGRRQARATVDDPQHGPGLRHLGASTGHSQGAWVPGAPCSTSLPTPTVCLDRITASQCSAAPGTQHPGHRSWGN